MVSTEEIKKLANLARIRVGDEELPRLSKDIESILGYIAQLSEVQVTSHKGQKSEELVNIMRDDVGPHEPGLYTESILSNAPRRQENYVVVKKIL